MDLTRDSNEFTDSRFNLIDHMTSHRELELLYCSGHNSQKQKWLQLYLKLENFQNPFCKKTWRNKFRLPKKLGGCD